MKFTVRGTVAACIALACAPAAQAAPVTVDLRVEGPNRTVFEGKVTTDVRTFRFTGASTEYTCDGTVFGGKATSPQPTRNTALLTASEQAGFALKGSWFNGLGASYTEIGGESVAFDMATNRYLVEYLDDKQSMQGGCAESVVNGSNVLFAYGDGSEGLLKLSGPATVQPGVPFTVKVTDAAKSGAPVAGASVGGQTTNGSGEAQVVVPAAGPSALKASRTGYIRSNGLTVCATTGADGACGTTLPTAPPTGAAATPAVAAPDTPDTLAPVSTLLGVKDGATFRLGQAPRRLSGTIAESGSGVAQVKLRISRRLGKKCWYYSGRLERFRGARCGLANAKWFKIGESADWSYLLPSQLPRGTYVIDVKAFDRRDNVLTAFTRGQNRVRFVVG